MRSLLFSVCLILSSFIEGQAQLTYDCRRPPGLPCSGNGICDASGTCICSPPFDGAGDFDCSLDVTVPTDLKVDGTECTPPCVNGGLCYKPDPPSTVPEECSCPPGFAGPDCSIPRGNVQCRSGDMIAEIYPQPSTSPFSGTASVVKPGTLEPVPSSGCMATAAASNTFFWNADLQRFSFAFSTVTSNCPEGEIEQTVPVTLEKQICYEMLLQYGSFISLTDETFKFCCTESISATVEPANVGDVNQPGGPGGVVVDGSVEVIRSRLFYTVPVLDVDNPIVGSSIINVGTELTLVVDLRDESGKYEDLTLLGCRAIVAGMPDIPFLVDGCPAPGALSIVKDVRKEKPAEFAPAEMKNKIIVEIWAFKPSATISEVTLMCSARPCDVEGCPDHTPSQCPSSTITNLGRKKRAAGNGTEPVDTFTTTSSYTIYVPVPNAATQTCEICEECGVTKEVFLPVAVVFGIVLLVVLVLAVFLCVRYKKGRNFKGSA